MKADTLMLEKAHARITQATAHTMLARLYIDDIVCRQRSDDGNSLCFEPDEDCKNLIGRKSVLYENIGYLRQLDDILCGVTKTERK